MSTRQKLLFYTNLIFLFLLSNCATEQKTLQPASIPQEKCDAPTWNAGDYWKFTRSDLRWWEYKVERIEGNLYIIKNLSAANWYGIDNNSLDLKFLIDSKGKKSKIDHYQPYFDFPLYVGKKWGRIVALENVEGRSTNYMLEFKVISHEDVEVAAGKFNAFKIEFAVKHFRSGESGQSYLWYSPEVKNTIKVTFEVNWLGGGDQSYELTSYKLVTSQKTIEEMRAKALQEAKLISPPPGVDIFEMPRLIEGDTWIRQTDKGKNIGEIERVDDSGVILRRGENKYYYDNRQSHIKTELRGQTTFEYSPPAKRWRFFPLWIGKKWEEYYTEKNIAKGTIYNFKVSGEVKGFENVQTPAGNFKALKIDCTEYNLDTGGQWSGTVWYSPEVKADIKSHWEKIPARNHIVTEFKLKQVESLPKPETPEKPTKISEVFPSTPPNILIVTGTSANIRTGAGNEFPIVTTVKQGDSLILIGEPREWFNVRLENGQDG